MNDNNDIGYNKPIVKNEFSSKKNNNKSIFSLVCGIMSIILFWALIYPIILGILGFILGVAGIISTHEKTTFSIIGIITSCIGFCIGTLMLLITLFF